MRMPDIVVYIHMHTHTYIHIYIHQESCPEVRVPDTVVYKGGFPANWYFHSKIDGRLLKKKPESLYIPHIYEAFGADNGTCETQVCVRVCVCVCVCVFIVYCIHAYIRTYMYI